MKDLYSFFNPKSVAIIGATDKKGKIGNILLNNLLELGYEGQIFPINPKYKEIEGIKCFPDVKEIQQEIDLILVAVPAPLVYDVIDGATGRGHNFVVISAGFSEIGAEGKEMEDKLNQLAEDREINILGPNCLGYINPEINLNASFSGGLPKVGGISFLSQSGALAVALLDKFQEESLGLSKIVSLGNKMQLGENELIEFLAEDESTKVIGLYLEGIENGKEFLSLISKISKKKPIIILKAGKSEEAQQAMLSHTGSLAGEAKVIEAAFKTMGIIEAKSIQEFINLLAVFSRDDISNKAAAVITNAGGPGVLISDSLSLNEIPLLKISSEAKKELKSFLPEASSVENPVDLLGDALADRYQKALGSLEREDNLGIIFCLVTPQEQTPVLEIAKVIFEFSEKSEKMIIPVFIGGEKIKKARDFFRGNGTLFFDYPEEVVDSLGKYFAWKNASEVEIVDLETDQERQDRAKKIIEGAKNENRKSLNAFEAEELLEIYDIPVTQSLSAMGDSFEFPLVLKVDGDKYLHKTDKGGVILGIKNQEELEKEVEKMKEKFPDANLIVQTQDKDGEEIILGIKRDESFGAVATFGLGGIFTEVFKKVDFVFSGMDEKSIQEKIKNGSLNFMFSEFRGKKPLGEDTFAKIISNLLVLANELPEIKEMDINPMFGFRESGEFKAVDVKVIL